MNLKKVKDTPKGVAKLYRAIDSLFTKIQDDDADVDYMNSSEDPLKQRALKVDEYASDLTKFIDEGKTTPQDLIQTIDEVSSEDVIRALSDELGDTYNWPDSLDDTLWDYIKGMNKDPEVDLYKIANTIVTSPKLPDEDCVIIADEILSAYE